MPRRSILSLTMTCLLALVARAAEAPPDAEIEKLIVGKWYEEASENGLDIKATTTYKKDGTLSGEATMTNGDRTLKLSVTGTWKVADGKITETVEKVEPPLPIPPKSTDTIVEINAKTFRYRN